MNYQIEVFCDNDLNANTYLLYDDNSCIIIDPANNIKVLSEYIGTKKVLGVLLTHGHYDHFKSLKDLLLQYNTFVYMHKLAYPKLSDIEASYSKIFNYPQPTIIDQNNIKFVNDGTNLELGTFTIKCWYTPGHTDCMMSYIIDDNMFSGDFIFKGSIGRTDLISSDRIKMNKMLDELKRRKVNYNIYPGHDGSTTLEYEKENNIYLSKNGTYFL